MLLLNQVSKTYVSKKGLQIEALKSTNLHFSDKGLVVILGKSGSGKTTLLNLIGGLDKPTTGNISIYDHPIGDNLTLDEYRNQYIGFIFQDYN